VYEVPAEGTAPPDTADEAIWPAVETPPEAPAADSSYSQPAAHLHTSDETAEDADSPDSTESGWEGSFFEQEAARAREASPIEPSAEQSLHDATDSEEPTEPSEGGWEDTFFAQEAARAREASPLEPPAPTPHDAPDSEEPTEPAEAAWEEGFFARQAARSHDLSPAETPAEPAWNQASSGEADSVPDQDDTEAELTALERLSLLTRDRHPAPEAPDADADVLSTQSPEPAVDDPAVNEPAVETSVVLNLEPPVEAAEPEVDATEVPESPPGQLTVEFVPHDTVAESASEEQPPEAPETPEPVDEDTGPLPIDTPEYLRARPSTSEDTAAPADTGHHNGFDQTAPEVAEPAHATNGAQPATEQEPPATIPGEEALSPEMARFLRSRRRDKKDSPFRGFDSPPGRF
jgi:hypothetical protein